MLKYDDILKQHLVVLGKTGAGKSSVLRVLVERLLDAQKPVCILDPKGDWHGLRAGANGTEWGYPVVIFGGDHADVPISPQAGNEIAELVGTGNRSCIIDMRGWMVSDRTKFFTDFAHTLFRTTRGSRYLVMDEVHNFAPQGKVLDPSAGKMLHWANRLASEGRGLGLTILSASQRPQKVHKDFLTCAETLIAMKVIHKLDRDAIKDWIDGCADITMGKQVLTELASLARGQAWVWSPEAGIGPVKFQFPKFKTYDSFSPSTVDDVTALPGWTSVDLDAVSERLATVTAEHHANDPKALKARIAELERKNPLTVDRLAATAAYDAGRIAGYGEGRKSGYNGGWFACKRRFIDSLNDVVQDLDSLEPTDVSDMSRPALQDEFNKMRTKALESLVARGTAEFEAINRKMARNKIAADSTLSPSARKIVDCIHRAHPVSMSFDAAARRAGISKKSSAYGKYMREVADCDELESSPGSGRYRSKKGFEIGGPEPDSLQQWVDRLPPNCGRMLSAISIHAPIGKDRLADITGISPTSSGLGSGLKELLNLELIIKDGDSYRLAEGL
jgi:hypothetical protein